MTAPGTRRQRHADRPWDQPWEEQLGGVSRVGARGPGSIQGQGVETRATSGEVPRGSVRVFRMDVTSENMARFHVCISSYFILFPV